MIEKNVLTEKTRRLLEYAEIMERVASRAMSEEAVSLIAGETPLYDAESVERAKEAVQAVLARIASGDNEPRSSLPSVGFLLPKLAVEGASLEIDEAFAIGIFVERGMELVKWLAPAALPAPPAPLAELLDALPDCAPVAAAVFRVLDKEGKMRDLPGLRAIRQRIRSLAAELETAVSRYAASDESRRMLQSAVPSQRDGRTVLAVKANFRARIKGIVHEVSSSGQTVFVEPEDVVEKNNELVIEQRNLDAEMRRIMRELTAAVSAYAVPLAAFHRAMLQIEVLRAKARYSRDTKGIFAKIVNSENNSGKAAAGQVVLKQARHPLVANAVPIDLEMGGGVRTLIVTGPNTGGKTVALKSVGLFALLNQSGLALPCAAGTVLPVFDGVYADIGDEQSIGQSLSTFSAHIANIAGIVSVATEHSLVLLDELGSGTDPQEGSAIAMAVLDCLIERGTRLIVTTHHGILKNYGYTRQGVENASVEFDSHTLSPTYRIITGIPGESRALDIAGRNGLPPAIVAQARLYLDEERSDVSALISGLKEKHRELDEAGRKARDEEIRLREERRRADLTKLSLRQKELELKSGAAGKLGGLLSESRKTLENLVREVREGELTREKTLKVKEFLGEFARTVDAENAALEEDERALAAERSRLESAALVSPNADGYAPFAPGMEVFAGKRRQRGTILRLDKKSGGGNIWLVETGSLKMRFPETELVPATPAQERQAGAGKTGWAADLASPGGFIFELNLRGMRLEEAIETLRRQIDAAVLSGAKNFSVVHGTGGGILQKGVHDYLRGESAVADYYFSRPEQGGFGRTEVVLR